MKSTLVISLLMLATMLCPAFAFADEPKPVAADETVAVSEDASTGDIVGDNIAEEDELYVPETAKDIKAEAKKEREEIKAEAKEETEEVKAAAKEETEEVKAEAKEETEEVQAESKEAIEDIQQDEKEALKEAKT